VQSRIPSLEAGVIAGGHGDWAKRFIAITDQGVAKQLVEALP